MRHASATVSGSNAGCARRTVYRVTVGVMLIAGCNPGHDGASSSSPLPQVTSWGGRVMRSPRVVPVTFMADPLANEIEAFVGQLAGSTYWTIATAEYGVGPMTSAPATRIGGLPPDLTGTTDVSRWLESEIASGSGFPQPTDDTLYALFFPAGQFPTSGFHSDVALPNGPIVTYAVVGTNLQSIIGVSSAASHELVEAATDPRPGHAPAFADLDANSRGWELLGTNMGVIGNTGGEIGDVCPFLVQGAFASAAGAPPALASLPSVQMPGIDQPVQRVWSNRAAAARHDPCVPDGLSPYFNSAPVLSDTVVAVDSAGGSLRTLGVHLPVGQTRTIELDLFSDVPTGPWTVDLVDQTTNPVVNCPDGTCAVLDCRGSDPDACIEFAPPTGLGQPGGPPDACTPCELIDQGISHSFDRTQGKDGDKIHLTITQKRPVPGGTHVLAITSTLGDARTVWPLIVVE